MTKILLVDDDVKILRILSLQLQHNGFTVSCAEDGVSCLEELERDSSFKVILLDIMLPGIDGISLCKKIKKLYPKIKIIMVSARDQSVDVINALDSGADDYVKKPFIFEELLARVKVAIRNMSEEVGGENLLTFKDLTINLNTYEVTRGEKKIDLSRTEFDLLHYLTLNKNIVQSREKIFENVWGYEYSLNNNIVDVFIKYLRDKVDRNFEESIIHTIRGRGYVIK